MMPFAENWFVPVEFKFVGTSDPGAFEGYGAVFGNIDSHGDLIAPGAFAKTLADHKRSGTMPGLYVEHGQYNPFGQPPLPVGVWTSLEEDDKGLKAAGRLSALDTDGGRALRSLMQDGAMRGLSIAYSVPDGGAIVNKKPTAGEPRRTLKQVDLDSVDIVRSPSNRLARVDAIKSVLAVADHDTAVKAVAAAITMHKTTMAGGDSPNSGEREEMLQHLKNAHKALTGREEPSGSKSVPQTIREFETFLREECGFSNAQARSIAENGFKSSLPRDEAGEKAATAKRAAIAEISDGLKGFSLPTF